MISANLSARLANIRIHPIKSLDPIQVNEVRIGPGGGLEFDRAWALYSADGQWVNGKRTAAVHLIRAAFAPGISSVTLSVPGDSRKVPAKTFAFPGDAKAPEKSSPASRSASPISAARVSPPGVRNPASITITDWPPTPAWRPRNQAKFCVWATHSTSSSLAHAPPTRPLYPQAAYGILPLRIHEQP